MKPVFWAALALVMTASGAQAGDSPECYDALVYARVVRQMPTKIPSCGDGCVAFSWPWFIDLDVRRVEEGDIQKGRITVLSVQHTWYLSDSSGRFRLRRNTAGGFNIIRRGDGFEPELCADGTPPARPYITSSTKTLDDLRREVENGPFAR